MYGPHPPAALAALDDFEVLIVPGRGNSGPDHWQTHLEARLRQVRRVQQANWNAPQLDPWALRIAIRARAASRPVLAVAHSFGCLAAAAAVLRHAAPIQGVLMVAPADPDRFGIPARTLRHRLRVPGILVYSRNDPWLGAGEALALSQRWGCQGVDAGPAGHINVDSGHGNWAEGDGLLLQLAGTVQAQRLPDSPKRLEIRRVSCPSPTTSPT
ncbi:MAG: alpha/beta hydrolase [Rhodocyclaceae bacterium]|nr:alpha/beta hydrolase [Rhodocyclaceae bacterium]